MEKRLPLSIVMITLNEEENLLGALESVRDIADHVFIVDSYSQDKTVDIALEFGATVVQKVFTNFGDHWNWTLDNMPINTPWTFMLAPDERVSPDLCNEIRHVLEKETDFSGYSVAWRLWFIGKPLNVVSPVLRLWKTGKCRISNVAINEHPIVDGPLGKLKGFLEHHDSPNLHHWYEKQNRYTTAEAVAAIRGDKLSTGPRLFGTAFERRMWLKQAYGHVPFRHQLMFLYCYFGQRAWRAGRAGFIWARLRADVYRMIDIKTKEMRHTGIGYEPPPSVRGEPHPGAIQADEMVNHGVLPSPGIAKR